MVILQFTQLSEKTGGQNQRILHSASRMPFVELKHKLIFKGSKFLTSLLRSQLIASLFM